MPRPQGRILVAQNRKARHDYHLGDRFEAGMVLTGTEVKSLRAGRASLADALRHRRRRRGLAAQRAHPRVRLRHLDEPRHPAQPQAAAAPQGDRQARSRDRELRQARSCRCRSTSPTATPRSSSPSPPARRTGTSARPSPRATPTARRSGPWRPATGAHGDHCGRPAAGWPRSPPCCSPCWVVPGLAPPTRCAASADVFDRFDVVGERRHRRRTSRSPRRSCCGSAHLRTPRPGADPDHPRAGRRPARRGLPHRQRLGDQPDAGRLHGRSTSATEGSGRNTYTRIRVGVADRTVTSPDRHLRAHLPGRRAAAQLQRLRRAVLGPDRLLDAGDHRGDGHHHGSRWRPGRVLLGGRARQSRATARPATVDRGGVARFSGANIPTGELLTVSVQDRVRAGQPTTPRSASRTPNAAGATAAGVALVGSPASRAVAVPFVGWWYLRRRTARLPLRRHAAGHVPAAGRPADEVPYRPEDGDPGLASRRRASPVAEAGLLVDGETQVRDTTATLVGLAVAGAIQLRSDGQQQVRLIDAEPRSGRRSRKRCCASLFPEGTRARATRWIWASRGR